MIDNFKQYNENNSQFPTMEEVESASPTQILRWNRFLPSPTNPEEVEVNNRIFNLYKEYKDSDKINSTTSKNVGW